MARRFTFIRRELGNIAKQVSSLPSYESYSWGPKRSGTAWFLYHCIFLVRLLSPLQWWKRQKRKPYRPVLHSSVDAKIRPDFHAADSELYLQCVLLSAVILWLTRRYVYLVAFSLFPQYMVQLTRVGWAILLVFLIESIQWTLYYALFRPLIERAKLNLYDEAEYLVMLPIVILTQLILLSVLWHTGLEHTALLLLNVSDPQPARIEPISLQFPLDERSQALFAVLLGQGYIVIVIASLIRVVPTLHVRKRPNITIVGFGDVARNRILPALLAVYHPLQLAVASDYLSDGDRKYLASVGIHSVFSACDSASDLTAGKVEVIGKVAAWAEAHSKFAIVAVPTPAHLEYLLQFVDRGIRLALEKPIVGTRAELDLLIHRSSAQLFENVFVLSYYWLEKGLSLNYLISLNPHYRPLLKCEPEMSMQGISQVTTQLGKLKSVTVEFLEGPETPARYWTELEANGGMAMETLVHPLTFVLNFARHAEAYDVNEGLWLETPNIRWSRNQARAADIRELHHEEIGPTFVEISGVLERGIQVNIRCGKYVVPAGSESRFLIAAYEHGWITTDLSKMITRVIAKDGTRLNPIVTLSNLTLLKSQKMRGRRATTQIKYQHQIDLLNTFFMDGWGALRFDDYPSQLDVLRELCSIIRTIPPSEFLERDSDVGHTPWIQEAMMAAPHKFRMPHSLDARA